ncbi:transcriptional regulator, BadM/Rrf2 family [Aeromonas sp. RU39B]|jgi:Rrf2 family nitric oxide-sensitive transcriptional repressor|uniref:Rrf2 family transcriptional regulator n=1 Tax=Aeromonas sp. RU39B TaxID=1907416 RepID=UPI000956E616|nr:Rrf2 family transcriptional regulator [Aeromonas sp. RU39B]SIQ94832.1 transcriptional regulator, BadM/Rrf2 family [Aeromonas sp. RU39B]
MQLTRFTDYALRTLTFLAVQPVDRLSTITEVAETFDISRNHVVKIVHQLGVKGYIETVRGKHGGIRLGRATVSINLRDVVVDMENILCPAYCKSDNCRLAGGCRIQGILRKAMNAFLDVLGEYTLADVVRDPERLCHLLGMEHDDKLIAIAG